VLCLGLSKDAFNCDSLFLWDPQPEQDGKKQTVWDIAFKPDGSLMVAAIGKRLVVFDPNDGTVLKQKQGLPARYIIGKSTVFESCTAVLLCSSQQRYLHSQLQPRRFVHRIGGVRQNGLSVDVGVVAEIYVYACGFHSGSGLQSCDAQCHGVMQLRRFRHLDG
jgi:hypothetical protein